MAVVISGNGIDMGGNPVSNASQVDGVVINENGDNVATTSNLVGFKNYIINGNFNVWQRGTVWQNDGYSCVDRWGTDLVTGGNKGTTSSGSFFYIANTVNYHLWQRIEINPSFFAGKTFTISISTQNDNETTFIVQVRYKTGETINVQADVGPIITEISNTPKPNTNSLTFTFPNNPTFNLGDYTEVRFIGTNVNAPTRWFNVQLEEGSVATPFEQRPYGLELSLCQRYYEAGRFFFVSGYTVSGANCGSSVKFSTTKRVIPTITAANVSASGGILSSAVSFADIQLDSFLIYHASIGPSSNCQFTDNWTASAEL